VPGSGHIVGPVGRNVERTADFWELYVRKFIYDYKLDQPQSNQALQILADAKKQAGEYLTSHSMDYERLQTRLAEAAGDAQAVAEIQKQMTELNKPLQVDMFNEMKERLDKIPTEAQREAQADSRPRRGMANAVHGAATAPGSRPRAIASRPWATRPATASRPSLRRSPASASATRSRTVASRPAAHR
jgi:arsenate reductase-like glutaredoxin family protein